jgi:hypothetical protein
MQNLIYGVKEMNQIQRKREEYKSAPHRSNDEIFESSTPLLIEVVAGNALNKALHWHFSFQSLGCAPT